MKNLIVTAISISFYICSAAAEVPAIDVVVKAFNTGNTRELAKYVDDQVELTLHGRSDNYSRAQAMMVLQHFFKINGVRSFQVKKKASTGNNEYCIGTLQTRSGTYRTIVFAEAKRGRALIKELRLLPI